MKVIYHFKKGIEKTRISKSDGVILVVTVLLILAVSALGIGMITNSFLSSTVGKNYRSKIQSFFASDGQMTLIAQEILDSNFNKYEEGYGDFCEEDGEVVLEAENYVAAKKNGDVASWFLKTSTSGFSGNGYMQPADGAANGTWNNACALTYDINFSTTGDYYVWLRVWRNSNSFNSLWVGGDGNKIGTREFDNHNDSISSSWKWVRYVDNGTYHLGTPYKWIISSSGVRTFEIQRRENNYRIDRILLTDDAGYTPTGNGPSESNRSCVTESNETYLSDLDWESATIGWGSVQEDASVEGNTITLNGTTYSKGIGTHAISDIIYDLDGNYHTFRSDIGVDDEKSSNATIVFKVFKDEIEIYNSGTMTPSSITKQIDVDITGCDKLRLHVGDADGSINSDHGDWANARLESGGTGLGGGTAYFGNFQVDWELEETRLHCFNISTESYMENQAGKLVFRTPLKQYVEVESEGLYNPYGPTADVTVTFYDFHSDRTNPEFEQPYLSGGGSPIYGLVADQLDAWRKPVTGPNHMLNYYIRYWFRPSSEFAGETIDLYFSTQDSCTCGSLNETGTDPGAPASAHGTVDAGEAFENMVFNKTITFTHAGNGLYVFDNDTFFPLDGQGFGSEWNEGKDCDGDATANHNYSYTMEIHRTFVKVPDQIFTFRGDDDVWLFVNNNLVLDIGGIHGPLEDTVKIDTIPGLEDFKTYNFDFFYCERHSKGSRIKITTNMLVYRPLTSKRRHWKRDYGMID